jgi:glycosyltransferase involved in cell wall biosynthesis
MACGTPVAALDRRAVREIVDDDVTGFVFGIWNRW